MKNANRVFIFPGSHLGASSGPHRGAAGPHSGGISVCYNLPLFTCGRVLLCAEGVSELRCWA